MNEIEQRFLQDFVIKDKRDRLAYELGGKKRRDGIGRFCHHAQDLLIPERIAAKGRLSPDEIRTLVKERRITGEWYCIAYDQELNARYFSFDDALQQVIGNGMAAILICGNMAIIETEQEYGTPMRYVVCWEK